MSSLFIVWFNNVREKKIYISARIVCTWAEMSRPSTTGCSEGVPYISYSSWEYLEINFNTKLKFNKLLVQLLLSVCLW